jgi:peptide chain release factor 3
MSMADDHIDHPVFLARNDWHLERTAKDFPKLVFRKTRE